ncbi:universal stress protein [Ramlibacter sp.]|uniref:universal stress protein n=1 Tax=Ramlibacter sp. TaxID=1917967 RepID=UPI003D0FA770
MIRRILVTTDGTTLSKKAARSAIELAAATGAELVALNVVPRYPTSYFEGGIIVATPKEVANAEKQWTDKAQTYVDAVRKSAEAAGVKVKTALVHSDRVAEAIVAAAGKHKCDLVVMASHGRKGIKRLLLGSETQHVLTHGTVPVLVVR